MYRLCSQNRTPTYKWVISKLAKTPPWATLSLLIRRNLIYKLNFYIFVLKTNKTKINSQVFKSHKQEILRWTRQVVALWLLVCNISTLVRTNESSSSKRTGEGKLQKVKRKIYYHEIAAGDPDPNSNFVNYKNSPSPSVAPKGFPRAKGSPQGAPKPKQSRIGALDKTILPFSIRFCRFLQNFQIENPRILWENLKQHTFADKQERKWGVTVHTSKSYSPSLASSLWLNDNTVLSLSKESCTLSKVYPKKATTKTHESGAEFLPQCSGPQTCWL